MDSLSTCTVCEEEFEKFQSVVVAWDSIVVRDATRDSPYPYGVNFEEDDAPYRAVYCTECWDSLVVYSWKLAKEKQNEKQNE